MIQQLKTRTKRQQKLRIRYILNSKAKRLQYFNKKNIYEVK